MGLILALQFYFNDKAQQNMLNEIEHLANSINIATNNYYREVLRSLRENYPPPKSNKSRDAYASDGVKGENLLAELKDEIRRVQELEKDLNNRSFRDFDEIVRNEDRMLIRTDEIEKEHEKLMTELEKIRQKSYSSTDKEIIKIFPYQRFGSDSLSGEIEIETKKSGTEDEVTTVYVDLNAANEDKSTVVSKNFVWSYKNDSKPNFDFTFQIPDFSIPDQPRFLQYSYNTDEIGQAFIDLRNKNGLITSGLFLLSIIAFFFVSRRFTQPIRSLKGSFEKVVDGNLDVSISSKSKDEIGDLTNSFNQMVVELQKNREREKILQQKERLASMGQLAAGVAHEIKNPLNAINLTIEHLRDKFSSEKETRAQDYINTIQSEIRRLDKIVNNFLSFIRSENLQIADTDVNELIRKVVHLLKREIGSRNIKLKLDLKESFVHPLDGERFKTVIMNVILNAVQAMLDGGGLSVSVNPNEKCVIVKDSGIGIPKKDLDHIFDLFYTTKSTGTGLGLPTAYKIVKEHNGNIQITSEVGKGTEVKIQL